MQRTSLLALSCAMAVGGAVGFSLARLVPADTQASDTRETSNLPSAQAIAQESQQPLHRPPAQGSTPAQPSVSMPHAQSRYTEQRWLDEALALDAKHPDVTRLRELIEALNTDAVLRATLIRRYGAEPDARIKKLLSQALGSSPTPDVADFSLRLAQSGDTTERQQGFKLMAATKPTAETYAAITRAIETESNPDVLAAAILALRRPPMSVPPSDASATVSQLEKLAQHQDASVRAESLRMLALWDKTGTTTEAMVRQTIHDATPAVRQAAVSATMAGHIRSDAVKTSLLAMLADANEQSQTKMGALQALRAFPLNPQEHATYLRAEAELANARAVPTLKQPGAR